MADVSVGADLCVINEAEDFLSEVPTKIPFKGTSCCPPWSEMVKKFFPENKNILSSALTPMVFSARLVKKQNKNVKVCFIGPCVAKKLESMRKSVESNVDYVITFEELWGIKFRVFACFLFPKILFISFIIKFNFLIELFKF